MELYNLAQKFDNIFKQFRYGNVSARKGVRNIIEILEAVNNDFKHEYDDNYYAELIKKGLRIILKMEAPNKETYKFLESNIVDNTLDSN